jgi:glyoxylase-like metal-dependent hydrolase (beta-lactamase superfamily II)
LSFTEVAMAMSGSIKRMTGIPDGLRLLDLPQPRRGFRGFIASWFLADALGRRILIDPGPARTARALLDELQRVTDGVDLVLLTHIHLDHSGGVGLVCERYREAKVLVHPRAERHLLDPERLWKSSLEAMGDVAELYGAPYPLEDGRFADLGGTRGMEIIDTPGHSPHHLAFIIPLDGRRLLFAGEAAGLYIPSASTADSPYIRPTTPHKFDGAAAQASLLRIEEAINGDELMCYGHWGFAEHPKTMISLARKQIDDWLRIASGMKDAAEGEVEERLVSGDPLLKGYSGLPDDMKERERIFIRNSVRGILRYVRERGRAADYSPAPPAL